MRRCFRREPKLRYIRSMTKTTKTKGPKLSPPRLVKVATDALVAQIAALETLLLALVQDTVGDPDLRTFLRETRKLLRLDAALGRLERWNREVRVKLRVLGDAELRDRLKEGLGGDAALDRWEARADRVRRGELPVRRVRKAAETSDVERRARRSPYAVVEGERFKLASLAVRKSRKGARRTAGTGVVRGVRAIPVWPCELRGEVGAAARGATAQRAQGGDVKWSAVRAETLPTFREVEWRRWDGPGMPDD